MAPIPLKSVVSVSSEDGLNPACNLLSAVPGGKWLCAVGNRTRTAEVLIELSKRVRIAALEICNCGSAFVEVLVSDSSNPDEEVMLLPMAMLMTANDSRAEKNTNKMARYGKERLSAAAVAKKWNRIRVRCVQKHNFDSQFGLRSLSVFSDSRDPGTTTTTTTSQPIRAHSLLSPSPARTPGGSVATPKQETPSRRHPVAHNKYPTLPTSDYQTSQPETPKGIKMSSRTPKRLKERGEGEDEDFEFSGVENQSRLFHECIKSKGEGSSDGKKGSNAILDRIAANAEKYNPSYHKKRLLKKAIPKADLIKDFVESYKVKDKGDLIGAARKMSSLDNDYEIGEEPEKTWEGGWPKKPAIGWSKKTKPKKPRARSGGVRKKREKKHSTSAGKLINWLSTRKKMDEETGDTGGGMLNDSKLGWELEKDCSSSSLLDDSFDKSDFSDKKAVDTDDPDITDNLAAAAGSPPDIKGDKASPSLVECPLCQSFFPSYAVEVHASQCMTSSPHTHPITQTLGNAIITID